MTMATAKQHSAVDNPVNELLIGFVELWMPNEDSTQLVRVATRSTAANHEVCSSTEPIHQGPGEGIAGAAWKQKAAIVLQEKPSELLSQLGAPSDVELAAIVALPAFRKNEIRGVLVFGLTSSFGAAEVWSRDDRDELGVAAGHYSGLPSFEFITRYTRFPKGAGVPGAVWSSGRPKIAQDLARNSSFIRSFGNDPAQVSAAIGLPVASASGFPACVLLLLQAVDCPISRRTELIDFEVVPATDSMAERVVATSSTVLGQQDQEPCLPWQQVLVAEAYAGNAPVFLDAQAESDAGFHIGWPVFCGDQLVSILGLTF